jgi:hypothetical protein
VDSRPPTSCAGARSGGIPREIEERPALRSPSDESQPLRGRPAGLRSADAWRTAVTLPTPGDWTQLRPHRLGIPGRAFALALLAACTPKVQLEAPKEPITINMNIKIEHEIRVKVDKDLDQLFAENDEIF